MFDRREFLKVCGMSGLGLMIGQGPLPSARAVEGNRPSVPYPYRGWEERYRQVWTWDAEGFAFHCSNCQGNCAWTVYARDGVVIREEQLAHYPQIHPGIPDANPRGCNKGGVHSQAMYEKDRLLHPLKRVGGRGEGNWTRVSWEEALSEIAEKLVDILQREGPGGMMIHAGTGLLSQGRRAGPLRLGSLLGAIRLYPASAVGDMFTGASLAYGITNVGHSLDAWFDADCVVLWGINPSVTRIPDAHYLWEARYNGARVISIAPDYNPSSIHADLWVPIRAGTDSFLALSLARVILDENLYNEEFVREQTDLPFLVRTDNRRLLRESDLKEGGRENVFYLWDRKTGRAVEAPGASGSLRDTLRLGETDPALEGTFRVRKESGIRDQEIEVTPVFELVRAEAARFSPEETASRTGVHPELVRRLARELAGSRKAILNIGFSLHKYAWGILACWGAALICALTGHAATAGGLDTEHNWSLGGLGGLSSPKPPRFGSGFLGEWMAGRMEETFLKHYEGKELKREGGFGPEELLGYVQESLEKKWLAYFGEPKGVLLFADNRHWRNKSEAQYRQAALERVELYVNVNHRMDSSAEWADYLLPALSHYEAWDIRGELGYHRFVNLTVPPPGLKPVGEARSEWEICRLLARHLQEAARARGLLEIRDEAFQVSVDGRQEAVIRNLETLEADFTMNGRLQADRDVVDWILQNVPAMKPWPLETAQKSGFIILNEKAGFTSPLYANRPYHSFERQVYLKRPYPTLSGRQQFYVDQELFLRLGASVPTARGPVRPSRYPLGYYSPHTRWGIHSQWRSNRYMLRLQRGLPHVYLNPRAAGERGIGDGDRVRVFNDVGQFYARATLHPSTPPWAVVIEHAWEPHQFEEKAGLNGPIAGLLSPLELAGGWGHLTFSPNWDGNQLAHESSVEIERASIRPPGLALFNALE